MEKTDDASGESAGKNVANEVVVIEDDGDTGEAECETAIEQKMEENDEAKDEQVNGKRTAESDGEISPKKTKTTNEGEAECETAVEHEMEENDEAKDEQVNGKRTAESDSETSPKKTKTTNEGLYCLFVGNLNHSKKFEEIKDSLAKYFMSQSLLVQVIRLDHTRKYAHVDLASEMDLTEALTLNGDTLLGKKMKIAKAHVKNKDKVEALLKDKKAKDARCLFVKNLPYTATKEDILKVFHKAVAVRFPGGGEGPSKGIAFVEFNTEAIAEQVHENIQGTKLQERTLMVEFVVDKSVPKAVKEPVTAEPLPSTTLFVNNVAYKVTEESLKKVFPKAVAINIPQSNGKSRGFAFVEFGTIKDATKALESSQNTELCKRQIRIQFCETRAKPEEAKILTKTLIVRGLAEKTSEETLKSAFEGAISARLTVDKLTGVSRGFGFVDFESEEDCKAAKEAMEDCEIDGCKVTVANAKEKVEGGNGNGGFKRLRRRGGKRSRGKGRGPETTA
ncbi:nucleolin-like [Diretmus argenteus]